MKKGFLLTLKTLSFIYLQASEAIRVITAMRYWNRRNSKYNMNYY